MAARHVVKAGRMVRQAGTWSRNRHGSKPGGLNKGEFKKQENGKIAGCLGNIQAELAQRDRKHREKYTGKTSDTWKGWRQ